MTANVRDASIVRSTINLAHDLGLRVVGEGVESADALAMIGRLGCDEAQGYHIARPLDGAALAAWMNGRLARRSAGALFFGRQGFTPSCSPSRIRLAASRYGAVGPRRACRRGLRLPGRELRRLHHRTAAVRSAFALFIRHPRRAVELALPVVVTTLW